MSLAFWCVLIAGLLPLLATAFAKAPEIRRFDNRNPRAWLAARTGMAARANAAQMNSFEAFPFFAAAVVVATLQKAPQDRIDTLAVVFIIARLAFLACYLADLATLRSIVWMIGMASVVAIFLTAA